MRKYSFIVRSISLQMIHLFKESQLVPRLLWKVRAFLFTSTANSSSPPASTPPPPPLAQQQQVQQEQQEHEEYPF